MSEKWRRSKAWDDAFLTGALRPVKWVLRALSSISLSVVLLTFVAVYGALASVPIGLLALIPTYVVYLLTFLIVAAVLMGLPTFAARRMLREKPAGRFAATVLMGLVLTAASAWVWHRFAWPLLHYDPVRGTGLRFFADFSHAYRNITIRRLPAFEMSELEFYGWWPMRAALMLFVLNLVVATVRRIEFNFKNIGVLTVHTGIIVIALGSVYYNGLKKEGDTVLLAGGFDEATGTPLAGPRQNVFYDNTRMSLFVDQFRGFEQRPLEDVPRYNNYNLGASGGESAWVASRRLPPWEGVPDLGPLDNPVVGTTLGRVDEDINFRVVGYAFYAEPGEDREKATAPADPAAADPLRIVFLYSGLNDPAGELSEKPAAYFMLSPRMPKDRVVLREDPESGRSLFSVEYTQGESAGMPAARWHDLTETLPAASYGLVIEVPGSGSSEALRQVYSVAPGQQISVGETGYSVRVDRIEPRPPFPIITKGYEDATSEVAVVTVTTPGGESFERWVYHRFPEINQDLLAETTETGRPSRRNADPSIRIGLIAADHLAVYIDEPEPGRTRAVVRQPGGVVKVFDSITDDWLHDVLPRVSMRIGERWEHARRVVRPMPVEESEQDKRFIGTHDKAMLAVEVSIAGTDWSRTVWLPFMKYLGIGMPGEQTVALPDGRRVRLVFGRRQHPLPGFDLRLVDFQMIAYDHRGAPRDYQSIVRVTPTGDGPRFDAFEHITKLNAPLTAPFSWEATEASLPALVLGRLTAGLNPNQFKFSQAGWDSEGWKQSQQQADQGLLPRPFATFTILGVGNNPGIHIIALGSVLMGIGIPWAFYIKPWLVRREKKRIQEQVAAGAYVRPRRVEEPAVEPVGAGS